MAYGSVAQPVLPTIAPAEKIQLSNAYSFGMFYDYGTKPLPKTSSSSTRLLRAKPDACEGGCIPALAPLVSCTQSHPDGWLSSYKEVLNDEEVQERRWHDLRSAER